MMFSLSTLWQLLAVVNFSLKKNRTHVEKSACISFEIEGLALILNLITLKPSKLSFDCISFENSIFEPT